MMENLIASDILVNKGAEIIHFVLQEAQKEDENVINMVTAEIWHNRLGHPGKEAQKQLTQTQIDECEICDNHKAKRKLGPLPIAGTQQERYIFMAVDDYTRLWYTECLTPSEQTEERNGPAMSFKKISLTTRQDMK